MAAVWPAPAKSEAHANLVDICVPKKHRAILGRAGGNRLILGLVAYI
ncbi:hypothetical protein LCGC14_0045110 [marine sediment metagenome]|uniref:Uncharacterized protein n=1 Tax=marine sediment metagenome TaxID=412755 RepID=A0A0F9VTX6_9ZZZZ